MNVTGQDIHDFLMANRPDGASHDVQACPFCTVTASKEEEISVPEERIYTHEQHQALLGTAVEKALQEASAESDAEVLRLNEELSGIRKTVEERDAKIADLLAQIEAHETEQRLAEVAEQRIEKVKEVANFSDEQIESRKRKWAEMDDTDFEALLADYKAVASASKSEKGSEKVPESKFEGTRETAGEDGTEVSAVQRLFAENLTAASI